MDQIGFGNTSPKTRKMGMEKPTLFIVGNTSSFMVHFVMLVYWSVPTPQQNMSMSSNHHFNQGISLLDMATLRSPGLKS